MLQRIELTEWAAGELRNIETIRPPHNRIASVPPQSVAAIAE
jgi:hypothetical protein